MIRSLILALAIFATASALPNTFDFRPDAEDELLTEPPPICPPPGLEVNATTFANHYNCSTYWLCESGVPTLKSCPPGLNFNVLLGVCDFPWATTCTPIAPIMPAGMVNEPMVAPAPKLVECQPDGPPICPPPGGPVGNVTQCPNPYNCSAYYYCDNGVAKPAGCPPGLEFNTDLGVCDFPWNANCVEIPEPEKIVAVHVSTHDLECQPDGPPICPPPGGPIGNVTQCPNPYNCSAYYYCDNGVAKPGDCPPELEFNAALGVCDYPWHANCVEIPEPVVLVSTQVLECQADGPPICPPPGGPTGNVTQCPNPYNCSAYYYCDNGVAKPGDCPPDLEFNVALGVCDFPWNANCVELESTTVGTTTEPSVVAKLRLTRELECQADGPPICPPPGGPTGNVTQCPNPYNCSAYYYCDNGVAKPGDCPPDLEFNVALGVCDFPWNANCEELESTTATTATEPTVAAEYRLTQVLECQDLGPPICPPPGGPTGNVTVCPNHLNCSMYYYCDNGFPHEASCPPGLEFNVALGVCDFPWNANCVEITTTEATTVTTTETTTDSTTTDIPTETTTTESKIVKYKFAHLKRNRIH